MFPELTRDDVFRLETRRLWLRWPRGADADAIVRQAGDKAVADMTGSIPHPLTPEAAHRFILEARAANLAGRTLTMAITLKAKPGCPIGIVAIEPDRVTGKGTQLGYWIGGAHWDQGYATEAARAIVDAFFAYTDGRELDASARVVNPASRRVLEKCGFAFVGSGLKPFPARGGILPVDHFRLDRRKWASLKAWRNADYVPAPREPQMEAALAL